MRRMVASVTLLIVVAGIIAAPGVATAQDREGPIVAPGPPPSLQYEVRPAVPGPAYVWIPGHWQYAPGWVWVPGEWVIAPYPAAVWVPGYWARRPYGWVWINGYWQAGGPGYAVVTVPPPPLRVEAVAVAPFPGAIWIGGFWRWAGAAWVWVPGHWGRAPWPRAAWIPGRWARRSGGWVWIGGYWR